MDYKYGNGGQLSSFNQTEKEIESNSSKSYELSYESRFKNAFHSTPLAPTGPVRLPYITGGGSPIRSEIGMHSYHKVGAHHHSISDASSYAIGAGKTVSSSNLKATVSGGKLYVSGAAEEVARERIEIKCSPNGGITKISPRKVSHQEGDSQYNHYYHKFRQQNKTNSKYEDGLRRSVTLVKNKFPLPFTGTEYPMIDGGGITSWGREGIYAENKPEIQTYNDFEKSWVYSLPDKFTWTANERPNYGKKKTKMENKMSRIVYDWLNSSPYYKASFEAEHSNMIDLNRQYVLDYPGANEDQKSKTTGMAMRKDKYYSYLLPYYALEDDFDSTLVFESRFESGNLRRVFKKSDLEYELLLKTDYNTNNYTQWFYFKVSNTRKNVPYTFKIINMVKPDSLYNHGMKVLSYSVKSADIWNSGWKRVGKNISYVQNNYKRKGAGNYYTLTFNVQFDFDDDSVYFAHWFPYTYTDLKYMLNDICTEDMRNKVRKTFLARTLAGNEFEGVIITNFTSIPEDIAERQWVVITGRVHPGESNSSFIVEGMIKFLISEEAAAKQLRNTFVFKIIPMLNPDGVIIGNYRCSLSGNDLNRQWKNPSARLHPEIFAVKEMFLKTKKCREVFCYVDCHGHSRK